MMGLGGNVKLPLSALTFLLGLTIGIIHNNSDRDYFTSVQHMHTIADHNPLYGNKNGKFDLQEKAGILHDLGIYENLRKPESVEVYGYNQRNEVPTYTRLDDSKISDSISIAHANKILNHRFSQKEVENYVQMQLKNELH